MLYQLYSLTDDGFEMSHGYFTSREDADNALNEMCKWRPNAYLDIREHQSRSANYRYGFHV